MYIQQILGKTLTNIFIWYEAEPYGLHKAEAYLQLNNPMLIHTWLFTDTENLLTEIDKKVISLFKNIKSTDPLYQLKDQKIIDCIFSEDDFESGAIELENGYIFMVIRTAPHGIGAGIGCYKDFNDFEASGYGSSYKKD